MSRRILRIILTAAVFLSVIPFYGEAKVMAAGTPSAVQENVRNSLIGVWEYVRSVNRYDMADLVPDTAGIGNRTEFFANGTGRIESTFPPELRIPPWRLYFDWKIAHPNILKMFPRLPPGVDIIMETEYFELIFQEPYVIMIFGGRLLYNDLSLPAYSISRRVGVSPMAFLPERVVLTQTASDLERLRNSSGHYVLGNNINVPGNWIPIQNFRGTFDGAGHTITISSRAATSNFPQPGCLKA